MDEPIQNDDIEQDFEEVAGQEDGIPDDGEIAETPIRITPELLQKDKRSTGIVEINLSTGEAVVVETSEKPKLTKKALKEYGAPIQVGETYYEGAKMEVDIYHGLTLAVEIERQHLIESYKSKDLKDPAVIAERETDAKRLILSHSIPETFSYQGVPDGLPPIEDVSPVLLESLWDAHLNVNSPITDNWVRVEVLRGTPLETNILLQKTFESFPVGGERIETQEMTDEELVVYVEKEDAKRAVYVATMLLNPCLSLNGEGNGEHPYPTESLSEKMMQCLYNAYRVLNSPAAEVQILNRFRRRTPNRKRKKRRA